MFTLYMPSTILIAAAVIPAIALLVQVYRADRVEPEPPALLMRLVLYGIIATSIAKLLERVGLFILNGMFRYETVLYDVLLYFGVVGFAEEGAKYVLLKRATWRTPDFNCRFDGVVYAAFVSLGFALWENIGYVLMNGLGTALLRAVTAIPGHACFGVFMGCWYAQAAALDRRGDEGASKAMRVMAVVVPALLHGAYDFLAVSYYSSWYFLAFVLGLFLLTSVLIRKLSREDRYI
ncbi:MAG: PrsW family intramembrane metalloprotease [Clostridia bacterium]|nr:PrsW family intramembrane metalloprotease [Clostridia bacterium]